MQTASQRETNPFADPNTPTLEDVLALVPKIASLTTSQRAARASAVRTVGRAIGLPLSAIPAHPAFLRKRLGQIVPAKIGLKTQSWRNAVSLLRRTLTDLGFGVMPGRYLAPIADNWRPLWDALPQRPFKIALSRFLRYCSTQGISPSDVDEAAFTSFSEALERETLTKKPYIVQRDARRYWNLASDRFSGWPQVKVSVPDRRDRYSVPIEDFPISMAADFEAYREAMCGDRLSIEADFRQLRETSGDNAINALHRIASAAVRAGRDPIEFASIAEIVEPRTVKSALRFIQDRNGGERLKCFDTLLAHVLSAARRWVRADEVAIKELERLKRALNIDTYVMSESTERVLRDLDDPRTLRALINLPGQVFEELGRLEAIGRRDAVRAEIALAIAILTAAPIRPKNLASLSLDQHILWVGTGKTRKRHLRFSAAEVKNNVDLEFQIPERLDALLSIYLDRYRPLLIAEPNLFLFPGEGHGHKKPGLLSQQIGDLTQKRIGVRVTAHKFRAVAGKVLLDQDPMALEVARQVLGHKSVATTVSYYAPLQRDRAIALYDEALQAARRDDAGGS